MEAAQTPKADSGHEVARYQIDHERPHEVELLLDREGPGDVQRAVGEAPDRKADVGGVEPEPDGAAVHLPDLDEGRQDHEDEEEDSVIKGEDAEDAAGVEGGEIAGVALVFDEDARDQVAGEDEEEVDARPAESAHAVDGVVDQRAGRDHREVVDHHDEDREAAHAVERLHARQGVGGFGLLRLAHAGAG
jgi:hypothetical protein